jgi:hypothetical protein
MSFNIFKCKKYQPKGRETTAKCLSGELCEIMVSPVEEKGKKIPQDIIFLSTLITKAALMLYNFLVTTARCFQPFG